MQREIPAPRTGSHAPLSSPPPFSISLSLYLSLSLSRIPHTGRSIVLSLLSLPLSPPPHPLSRVLTRALWSRIPHVSILAPAHPRRQSILAPAHPRRVWRLCGGDLKSLDKREGGRHSTIEETHPPTLSLALFLVVCGGDVSCVGERRRQTPQPAMRHPESSCAVQRGLQREIFLLQLSRNVCFLSVCLVMNGWMDGHGRRFP